MKKKALIDNASLTVLNTLSAAAFLFVPQFANGTSYCSVTDLLINNAVHRAVWAVLAALGVLMNVISALLYMTDRQKQGNITLLFLPIIEIIILFAVMFNFLSVHGGNSVFFSQFVVPAALTVFFAPLIQLYKVKVITEE